MLFTFALRDKAKVRLNLLPQGSIITWNELAQTLQDKYFPLSKTIIHRNKIFIQLVR